MPISSFVEPEMIKEMNLIIPFRMPFPRNHTFTGRGEELRTIHKYLSESRSRDIPCIYALTGIGGMGKTQIVLEYAYQYQYDYTAIFWVSATSEDTIRTSLNDIMQ